MFSLLAWIVLRKESFDVTLHLFLKTIPLFPESVKGREACGLELILFDGSGMADKFGLFRIKPGQTAPYHGFLAAVVPLGSVEVFSAFAAEDNLGKGMAAAESAFSAVCGDTGDPAHQFILHLEKDVFWNNGLVVTLHIILRHYAVVLYPGLVEKVGGVGLLEQGVSDVLFIPEDLVDGRCMPCGLAGSGGNAVPFKSGFDLVHAVSFLVFPVDALYDFSLLRINDEIAFRILGVAQKAVVVNQHLSLLVAVLKPQLDVLGQRLGFLLRQRGIMVRSTSPLASSVLIDSFSK